MLYLIFRYYSAREDSFSFWRLVLNKVNELAWAFGEQGAGETHVSSALYD